VKLRVSTLGKARMVVVKVENKLNKLEESERLKRLKEGTI